MDDSNTNPPSGSQRPGMSRRALLKGAGLSAVSTVLDSGIAGAEFAESLGPGVKVLGPGSVPLALTVNGRSLTVRTDPGTTLVELLRLGLGMTGTKVGCDRGACSACTVWVDGEVAASCMTFALDMQGKKI